MAVNEALLTVVGGGAITAILGYLGIRYSSRKSSEVARAQVENDARKVDREQFQEFTKQYERDQEILRRDLDETRTKLRASISYIRTLRREMLNAQLTPPPVPQALESTTDFW